MKKKNLQHNGLRLNRNTISNLRSEDLKGGTNASIFRDKNGNCFETVTGCPQFTINPQTCADTCQDCPPDTLFSDCGGNCGCETNGLFSC
ncbi:MAG: hypothetical protein AAF611_11985 [Bacteroidota bacterium]